MIDGRQPPHHDLEAFQRWALGVDDQLRDAVDAMMALEEPDSEPPHDCSNLLQAERSSADLATDLIPEINAFTENPDRPAWFTPMSQMVLKLSTWAEFLKDYVDKVAPSGSTQVDAARQQLLLEKIFPAIDHYRRFLDAVHAADLLRGKS
jgi:hypothetical protein